MKMKRFSVILAVLLVAILALGAVSAESIDNADLAVADDSADAVSIDSIDDVSVQTTDKDVKNSLGATSVGDDISSYDINDTTYSTYFNDDGTPTDELSVMGDYTLNIGTISNKDIVIDAGSNIKIIAKEGEGFINNGAITIGDGEGTAGSVLINGLTFTNTDKNAIVVNDLSTDVNITENKLYLTYTDNFTGSAMAITTYGYVDGVNIIDNEINMESAASYTYGIDLSYYLADWKNYAMSNAENFVVSGNAIDITSTAASGMAEAMYLDTIVNSEISGNEITVTTINEGVANYGMQVADSWGFSNDDFASSPYGIEITDNEISLDSADLAYGITVISLWPYDDDHEELDKDIHIAGNTLEISSATNATAIGVKSADAIVKNNYITIIADENKEFKAYPDPAFGNKSAAISLVNKDDLMGFYADNTIIDNNIHSNLENNIRVTDETDARVSPLVIEDNIESALIIINDDSYSTYFDEDGTAKDTLDELGGYTLFIEEINNKNIVIDSGSDIEIFALGNYGKIINGTITIGDGAGTAGTIVISDLEFINENKDAIVVNDLSTGISIVDNSFDLTYTADYVGSPMAIVTYGYVYDVEIVGNTIDMNSAAAYTYGIDLSYYLPGWLTHAESNAEEFYIADNVINIVSTSKSGMAEAMYLDTIANSVIENNKITVTTEGATANYGMQVSDSWGFSDEDTPVNSAHDLTIKNNTVILNSEDMAYGITVISLSNLDMIEFEDLVRNIVITENMVTINSEKGAIAIGSKSSDVEITDNTIEIDADADAINQAYPDPAFGNNSAAIYLNTHDDMLGNYYNITVSGNEISSNVLAINLTQDKEENEPIVIEDNDIPVEVSIEITADASSANVGQIITYTITVTNAGPNAASDVVVSAIFSDLLKLDVDEESFDSETLTWDVGVLGVGESADLEIQAEVLNVGVITSTADVEVSEYEQNTATETEDTNTIISSLTIIDDSNYDTYFDENGTIKDDAPLGDNYPVLLGNLTNKKLNIDVPLLISADANSKLVNTTIALKEGADGTAIQGLTFEFAGDNSTGSTPIIYAVGVSDISILGNKITVTDFVDADGAKWGSSLYAIEIESGAAGCDNVSIAYNEIDIKGSSRYLYGIDVFQTWGSENKNTNVNITDNTISVYGASRMSEPIYASGIDNAVIANNTIDSFGQAAGYGIGTDSLNNSVIADNDISVLAGAQAYGITSTYSDSVDITGNNITSIGVGAVGVGLAGDNGAKVDGNEITITGGDYTRITSADSLGTANAAILDKGNNNIIGENKITENIPVTINDENYADYFDENGNIIDASKFIGSIIFVENLTNKALNIDVPLKVKGLAGNKLVNTTITLKDDASGSEIDGLNIEFTGDNTTGSTGIIYAVGVSDITIANNNITVPDFVDADGAKWGSSIYAIEVESGAAGANNVVIKNNNIDVEGSARYLYGIDVFQTWGSENKNTNVTITDNTISVSGASRMSEPIYASAIDNAVIANNTITSSGVAAAYGIGTDSLSNSIIADNGIGVLAGAQAYGITSTYSDSVDITGNNITSAGTGAVGVGLAGDDGAKVDGNNINIIGEDYTSITSADTLGTANAAILDKGADNIIGNNTITEDTPIIVDDDSFDKYFNEDGTIKDDAPIKALDTILIGKLSDKRLVIDVPVIIKPAATSDIANTVINLVEGADGSIVRDLNITFTGDESTGSVGIIYVNGISNVTIFNNTILVPEFVNKEGSKYGSSVYAIEVESGSTGTDNINIMNNYVEINGTANYLYGIDAFTTWGANTTNSNLTIDKNTVIINGGARMAEAIYVSTSEDVTITNNNVSATSEAAAYGIGTDLLDGAKIANNTIDVIAGTTAYGITSTVGGEDIVIDSNDIMAQGISAVGVGLSGQDNVTIKDNEIETVGGDYASVSSADTLGTANAAILDKDNKNTNLVLENNTLTENGKAVNATHNGNASSELQALIDAAEPGSTLDLEGVMYSGVSDVVINKNLTITNGTISGKAGETVFVIPAKSEGGPDEVTINGVDFIINNGNTIVKATADNGTAPTSIDTPAITLTNNTVYSLNDDVVRESVTVLELESERGSLAPTSPITVEGNTLDSGVDPFEFKVTGVTDDNGNTVIPKGGDIPERQATVIQYQDMNTTAVNTAIEGRVGKYFEVNLTDANGNPLADKAVQIGFNGKIYNRTTNATGGASLQINLAAKGTYTFAISFLGDDNYNASFVVSKITVSKQNTKLTTANKSYKASAKTKTLTATLKSSVYNKAINGKKVTFTVNGKTYSATTNSKGVATVKVSLSAKKTYSFTAKFAGNDMYAASSVKGKVTIK